jgi:alpha/beta superfamily hydrolase
VVTRGQYLERPALIPVGPDILEGLWHRGARMPPLLILPPPPEAGSMDHVICAELAWASARAGHPVLRFNFRGVGASQGMRGAAASRLEDAVGALRVLRENAETVEVAVAAIGASASTGLELARTHPGVLALVLVSSPADPDMASVSVPLLCVVGEEEPGRAGLAAALDVAQGRLEVIPGADARFQRGLPRVGQLAIQWMENAFKRLES